MQKLLISLITLASLTLGACSIDQFRVYRINVQQGNALEQEDVDRIQPGMTKRQVEFLLGTPMVTDPFRVDRWDYVFYFKPGYGKPDKARLSLWFEGDKIVRMEQDGQFEMPGEVMDEEKRRRR